MRERIASGFDPFVLPFLVGMAFVLLYCFFGALRVLWQLPREDRRRFLLSLFIPATAWKNVKDIFLNCLLHVKLWKRNPVLGYMHSSIAFGWFMLIVLGHLEVYLFVPSRLHLFYYPIFFNYFVAGADMSLQGAFLFFLMDLFLLVVLSGITLAIIKRIRSDIFGMRRTTRASLVDTVGMYALWSIFPLRLLAEGFTAGISGGSFLIKPLNWLLEVVFGTEFLQNGANMLPTWWAYSIALFVFMVVLPFSRYMHIPAEMMLIPMRNAGLRIRHPRRGFALMEVYSCPGCGVCIDACPMSVKKGNLKDCTVYLNRQIRRGNEKRIEEISDKCLLCGKCTEVCQVGVEGPALRIAQRSRKEYGLSPDYAAVDVGRLSAAVADSPEVLYFAGCMTQLTPSISRSVCSVLDKAGVKYRWMDRTEGLCCGRPMLQAGRFAQAKEMVRRNTAIIKSSGAKVLLLSCPICYKMFKEHYKLEGIEVVHHSVYFDRLRTTGKITLTKGDLCYAYHDPCELGRGCKVYDEPRNLVGTAAYIVEAGVSREASICCGGSLGSISLSFEAREAMTRNALDNLCKGHPDAIATACPLCLSTFSRYSEIPVRDIAEVVDASCQG
ncbi:MAG: (Fe-S)-binding protein [Bacteroidales bacterium]|nr:(Fe-S)-binding protein [Bacteroidales bacterium]